MQPEKRPDERRQYPRQELQAAGQAYVLCKSQVMAIPVWTRNISEGGALIVAEEELQGQRMLLQLMIPQFQRAFIECDVRHRSSLEQSLFNGQTRVLFSYGLQFGRVLNECDVHATLLAAFQGSTHPNAQVLAKSRAVAEGKSRDSLVPFLSALGLAVVYASQYPWH